MLINDIGGKCTCGLDQLSPEKKRSIEQDGKNSKYWKEVM